MRVRNNIFQTTGGARFIDAAAGQNGLLFQGNNYFATGGVFDIRYAGVNYASFSTWRSATGQEHLGSTSIGMSIDPCFINLGGGGSLNNADLLATLDAYKLQSSSPMVDTGLNLSTLFGVNIGTRDFYGNSLPQGVAYDIGASEFKAGTTAPPTQIVSISRLSNGSFQISITGPTGVTNSVEASTNLVAWVFITNVTGTTQVTDTTASPFPRRFYRIRKL